jgi:hypothetical protein
MNPVNQGKVDAKMKEIDGTDNKGKLGANAILAVSMAVAKVTHAPMSRPTPLRSQDQHLVLKPCRLVLLRRVSHCTSTSQTWLETPGW